MELSSLCHESLCWPTHRRRDAAQCLATRNANTAVPALLATPHFLRLHQAECADLYHHIAAVFLATCGPCCRRQEASRGHLRCPWLPFLVATAVFLTWRLCATSLGCPRLTPPLRRALSESSPSCAPFQPCRHIHGCSPPGITGFPCSHPCGPIFWESC